MAERSGGGTARDGHRPAATERPSRDQARRGGGEPRGCGGRRNAERRRGPWGKAVLPESRGAVRAQASRGCGTRSPPVAGAKPPLRPPLPARGLGAKGTGGRGGAAGGI